MKLKRTWPGICIWVIFIVFDVVMVASSSYFSGLFSNESDLMYSVILTALSVLLVNIAVFALGKFCDHIRLSEKSETNAAKAINMILIFAMMFAAVAVRLKLMTEAVVSPSGKLSLYENAMIGGENISAEYDLLSILYSFILKLVLFFTGNWISVALFFQLFCFAIFMICGYLAVRKLLGMSGGIVFTAYIAFMPIFFNDFKKLIISTDMLFMAMFGVELLIMALFIRGAYLGNYKSKVSVIWYLFVGISVGFMAYLDAGTIIMIAPFFFATLFLTTCDRKKECIRLLFVLLGAVLTFGGMILQQSGPERTLDSLDVWASYYFHNLNTFSMFWTYTDYKIIYLVTVAVMSGVIFGYWRNRNYEKVTPWLLSMLLIFATVPFMGATRMNTQVFVSVYYAFVLGCVASLITMHSQESAALVEGASEEEILEEDADQEDTNDIGTSEVVTPQEETEKPERQRFVPEGMVVPEDDEDIDAQPRMNMSRIKSSSGLSEGEKLKVKEVVKKEEASAEPFKDDFDIALKPGDDFDIK
ncbi:MAG: hypothetical protein K6G10_10680 [Butyrivibrio sp.]|nr:hypothetical protein [Butyrivibrio sp.]